MSNAKLCPCGSDEEYELCCAKVHQDHRVADSAERLMRARFSAFALGNARFLVDTLYPSKRELDELQSVESNLSSTRWLSLKVLAASYDEVEFVAFYKSNPFGQLHERSRFMFEQGLWYYVDGIQLPPLRLGRNERCPCGSTEKYKKCCA